MRKLIWNLFTDFRLHDPEDRQRQRKPQKKKDGEAGFTLVELMVVIVIIGLLATVVVINVMPSQDKAMTTKARADLATISQALEMYRLDNMSYPSSAQGLVALTAAPAGLEQPGRFRSGGYIKKLPNDPWGNPYQYQVPGQNGDFDVYSLGADASPGGSGENADIYPE